jgi:hypothetical protein
MKPLAIDLFCGLGGWSEALLAEGYDVVGFDIERHRYPARAVPSDVEGRKVSQAGVDFNNPRTGGSENRSFNYANQLAFRKAPLVGGWAEYPAQLVIQDVLTLRGRQFRDAALIVASPPCNEFSYMAMPWSKAKAKAAAIRADETGKMREDLTRLFDACFRIQREACEAAGWRIPLIVENVRGAIPWVGRSRWNFGSFHLWGDVPALMPLTSKTVKIGGSAKVDNIGWTGFADTGASWRNREHLYFQTASVEHIKCGGDWFNAEQPSISRLTSSKSPARRAASAIIAKIPEPLARHIAVVFYPR